MNIFTSAHIGGLERKLGVSFDDRSLLELAFIHSSFIAEFPDLADQPNERLEFLGDALIDLVIAHALYGRFPGHPEGQLTQMRAALVSKEALAQVADNLGLGEYLVLGKGEMKTGGLERQSNLANVFEALVGAIFLDKGYDCASDFTLKAMQKAVTKVIGGEAPLKHPKSLLHEKSMSKGYGPPIYEVIEESGADHKREFIIQAWVNGVVVGKGVGLRKSLAEREAAKEALRVMEDYA